MFEQPTPPSTVCVIGHLTRDRISIAGSTRSSSGGTALYSSIAYARLGLSVRVLTKSAPADRDVLTAPLRALGCIVDLGDSAATTEFHNALSSDLHARSQRVVSLASPFEISDLHAQSAQIVHLGPLTHQEMSTEFLLRSARQFPTAVLDVQGLVRRVDGQRVVHDDWLDAGRVLGLCQIVKADADEAFAVTRERDPIEAARRLRELGAREVLLTLAEGGSFLAVEDWVGHVPAVAPRNAVDSTGAGDTFTAGYVFSRLAGKAPLAAARFASALASLSIEAHGPFAGALADVEARLAS